MNNELKNMFELEERIQENILDKFTPKIMQWEEVHRNSNAIFQKELKEENQNFLTTVKNDITIFEKKVEDLMSSVIFKVHNFDLRLTATENSMWPKSSYYIMWMIVIFTMGLNIILLILNQFNIHIISSESKWTNFAIYTIWGVLLVLAVNCYLSVKKKQKNKDENIILLEILDEVKKNSEFRNKVDETIQRNSEFIEKMIEKQDK